MEVMQFTSILLFAALLATPAFAKQSPIQVDDYLLDQDKYVGKTVTLVGSAMCISIQVCMISKDGELTASIYFDPTALPRDQRKALLACNVYTAKCIVDLTGQGSGADVSDLFQASSMVPQ